MRILALFCVLMGCLPLNGQKGYFGKSLYIGSSFAYITDVDRSFEPSLRYNEWTWNTDATVRINSFVYGGMRFKRIFTNGTLGIVPRVNENYYTIGLIGQVDLFEILKNKHLTGRDRLLFELSWDYGNYCVCERIDPHKVEGLQYFGWGASYDLAITSALSLDIGINANYILNYPEDSFSYTHYILGLNFLIGGKNDQ